MFKTTLPLLISLAAGSIAIAETATQTDWSGGAGFPGPVLDWGAGFDMENGVNWYSSKDRGSLGEGKVDAIPCFGISTVGIGRLLNA